MAFKIGIWPGHNNLVGHGETSSCSKHFARITNSDVVAKNFCNTGKCCSEVNRTKNPHVWWRRKTLHKNFHHRRVVEVFRSGLAIGAVMPHARCASLKFAQRIATNNAIEFNIAKRTNWGELRRNDEPCSNVWTFNNCCKANRSLL